ncbi:beta-lactamase/transpeptidase-like protein [Hyaloraphidium curvatum]|nr:beta-lactamase/transpeptidase-like protein [Hyaloraphidium curvatum]
MVAQVYGHPYEVALAELITRPLGLSKTLIPPGNLLPSPHMRGYDLESNGTLDDVTTLFAAGWSWSSGGVASTVPEVAAFFRAYVSGKFATPAARRAQFRFVPGNSEPPGPGTNAAGMALFRYVVPCRGRGNVTVYGHTGNTPGYTAFAAASADGRRSAAVSIGAQITATTNAARFPALREVFRLAVCAAMA